MPKFKPQISYVTKESERNYYNTLSYMRASKSIVEVFDTYRELKKNLKRILEENIEQHATVSRSRRGEWGEWFEHWQLINGKPTITKQGWM